MLTNKFFSAYSETPFYTLADEKDEHLVYLNLNEMLVELTYGQRMYTNVLLIIPYNYKMPVFLDCSDIQKLHAEITSPATKIQLPLEWNIQSAKQNYITIWQTNKD